MRAESTRVPDERWIPQHLCLFCLITSCWGGERLLWQQHTSISTSTYLWLHIETHWLLNSDFCSYILHVLSLSGLVDHPGGRQRSGKDVSTGSVWSREVYPWIVFCNGGNRIYGNSPIIQYLHYQSKAFEQ